MTNKSNSTENFRILSYLSLLIRSGACFWLLSLEARTRRMLCGIRHKGVRVVEKMSKDRAERERARVSHELEGSL